MMHGGFWRSCTNFLGYGTQGLWWMVLVKGIVLLAIVYLAYRFIKSNENKDVLEALKLKYVNGELSEEEYKRKRELLKK